MHFLLHCGKFSLFSLFSELTEHTPQKFTFICQDWEHFWIRKQYFIIHWQYFLASAFFVALKHWNYYKIKIKSIFGSWRVCEWVFKQNSGNGWGWTNQSFELQRLWIFCFFGLLCTEVIRVSWRFLFVWFFFLLLQNQILDSITVMNICHFLKTF